MTVAKVRETEHKSVGPVQAKSKKVAEDSSVFAAHQQLHTAPFTIKELRDAIPAHCFERSVIRSSSYLVADLAIIAGLVYAGNYYNVNYAPHTNWIVAILFWNVFWFVQGAVMTGLWVIAHECGHQSFSKWKLVNDTVGWILHSALFVPYHAWRITHGTHHKNTSHMSRDQVYVPKLFKQVANGQDDVHNAIAESPLVNLIQIVIMLTVGWPFYLATNAWGQDYGRRANHFEPSAPMFKSSQRIDIIVSNLGLIMMAGFVGWMISTVGLDFTTKFYIVPYFWVNFWLVLITYLQHTDVRVPHFRGEEWNFIRGALCTIDRDYGLGNHVFHGIGNTHVAHHLFSQMPHYHAGEATEALKKVLGKYYLTDNTPIMVALWKAWNTCHYVDDSGEVVYYKTLKQK
eukprot:TRINITY_DN343_c0_g1_i1.p1 TRINITY_DN343_c0_g1~~TRINITY_DN343_c0_g1_i1.p1  ORF type:complete len:401 (+),score=91.35 TRINITY_DN343_c0_g1_i1:76-1278(+)